MMSLSWWCNFVTIFSISTVSIAMNSPVYKIVLNSKGYAQFIQYDVDVATLREFTLCVWVRVSSLESDQSIFTYIGTDDKRIMRLSLDGGGRQMRISLGPDRVTSSADVEFTVGAWRDVCLSYQADQGAWALYVDAALVLCEGSPKLLGVELPGEGNLIFGYGISEKGDICIGFPTGLSGEIYGASMILRSTIDRNITTRKEPWIKQKTARKNKLTSKNRHETQYIVLGDLHTDEVQNALPLTINKEYENIPPDLTVQKPQNEMKFSSKNPSLVSTSHEMDIHDFSIDELRRLNEKENKRYSVKLKNNNTQRPAYEFKTGLTGSGTQDLPIVLEYETPPSITASTADYAKTNTEKRKPWSGKQQDFMTISDVEKPPPPEHNPKVYGQWTSSKFANNVLNYLKSIDFNTNTKQNKLQSMFPKTKLSDLYPYPSSFTYNIIRPRINYNKRKLGTEGHHTIMRRNLKAQQINVQIIKPDDSDTVLSPYKRPDPKLVEVTNRGVPKRDLKKKLHLGIAEDDTSSELDEIGETNIAYNSFKIRPLDGTLNAIDRHRGSNLLEILPFIKSQEYLADNRNRPNQMKEINQLYSSNMLSNNNKRHKVQFYDSDYTPNIETKSEQKTEIRSKPGRHKHRHIISNGESIMAGRALAKEVSNQAKKNIYNIPLLKFKNKELPVFDPRTTTSSNVALDVMEDYEDKEPNNRNNFNKPVKLGNALNERFISGFDEKQIKKNFLDGNDEIPDINRHRSQWDSKVEKTPAPLLTRVCNNIELYVHEDETIGKSKFMSPFQRRNIAIEFVQLSYKKCSMKISFLSSSPVTVIDWAKTPVKLFGGAYVKKTTDLCGFF